MPSRWSPWNDKTITTRYPCASPEDVALNITNKIAEALKEVDGIRPKHGR